MEAFGPGETGHYWTCSFFAGMMHFRRSVNKYSRCCGIQYYFPSITKENSNILEDVATNVLFTCQKENKGIYIPHLKHSPSSCY